MKWLLMVAGALLATLISLFGAIVLTAVFLDTRAVDAAAVTLDPKTGYAGLMRVLYDWQQGWGGAVAAIVAGLAAWATIRATRNAAAEQVAAADRQVATAEYQLQVSLRQERLRELSDMETNLLAQMAVLAAYQNTFATIRGAVMVYLKSPDRLEIAPSLNIPERLNLNGNQTSIAGLSPDAVIMLGRLISAATHFNRVIARAKKYPSEVTPVAEEILADVDALIYRIPELHQARLDVIRAQKSLLEEPIAIAPQ